MKLFLPALLLPLAGLALADSRHEEPKAQERVLQFQRDMPLIEALVHSGLDLALEDEPLQRARVCNELVGKLSQEIRQAVTDRNGTRASWLGSSMQLVLERGVAGNLNNAFRRLPKDAPLALEFKIIAAQVDKIADPIQSELDRVPAADREYLQSVLTAVHKGQAEVQKALKGQGKEPR